MKSAGPFLLLFIILAALIVSGKLDVSKLSQVISGGSGTGGGQVFEDLRGQPDFSRTGTVRSSSSTQSPAKKGSSVERKSEPPKDKLTRSDRKELDSLLEQVTD